MIFLSTGGRHFSMTLAVFLTLFVQKKGCGMKDNYVFPAVFDVDSDGISIFCKRKINWCIEKAQDLCYPLFISLGLCVYLLFAFLLDFCGPGQVLIQDFGIFEVGCIRQLFKAVLQHDNLHPVL